MSKLDLSPVCTSSFSTIFVIIELASICLIQTGKGPFSQHRMQYGRQMSFTHPNTVLMCSPDDVFTRKLLFNICTSVFMFSVRCLNKPRGHAAGSALTRPSVLSQIHKNCILKTHKLNNCNKNKLQFKRSCLCGMTPPTESFLRRNK